MSEGPTGELPRGVRVGYGMGSVATGAFGTVPGLMLLPYLTDTLGVAAVLAGVAIRARNRHYSEVFARESADEDGDGIPDVYESPDAR